MKSINSDLSPGDQLEIISGDARRAAGKIAGRTIGTAHVRLGRLVEYHNDRRFVKIEILDHRYTKPRATGFEIWFSIKDVAKI
ncbi:MAG: hypothetical protein GTN53_22970 [Candidatus Aminicenantes bacterium]|nr:hypothetical protein [Candidatus Aminicenantes bacterium]NIQ69366.1 hypothetical protein [Candidatus Aminicenantes bacterium]NIT25367.1 hypothetical protein [Candidatus Aminicenantes bacterium]